MMIMKRTILILLLTFSLVNVVNAEGIDQDRIKGMPLINGWKLRLDDLSSFYIQSETKSSTEENINRADYISAEGKLDSERFESGRIDVKEGEVIEFTRSWGPVIIAISKAIGLFMD